MESTQRHVMSIDPPAATPRRLRVLIVDDHEAVQVGLRLLLGSDHDIEVVGSASDADGALKVLVQAQPDVVVVDFRLPGRDGASLCAEIVRRRPEASVLMLSSEADDEMVIRSLSAGARGFLLKTGPCDDLPDAVRRVARGEALLAPEIVPRVVEWASRIRAGRLGADVLSPIEIEIVRHMAAGWSYRRIAEHMRLPEETVRARVRGIKRSLGASDRTQAVALAVQKGLI